MKKPDEFFIKNKAKFITGATSVNNLPKESFSEFSFIGRSNVGKSSLINAIANQKIAITSKTPGRTRQINFFNLADKLYLVDLPGYGFAKVKREEEWSWIEFMFKYLSKRKTLKRVFLLIDCRRGIKENDKEVMEIMDKFGVQYQIILTKTDKIKKTHLNELITNLKKILIKHAAACSDIISTSALKNYGISEIRGVIYDSLK